MLIISRKVLRTFRAMLRRGGFKPNLPPSLAVCALTVQDGNLLLQAAQGEVAIELTVPGNYSSASCTIPLTMLAQCEGKTDEPVEFDVHGNGNVQIGWQQRGIPQLRFIEAAEAQQKLIMPPEPVEYVTNPPELWSALAECSATADSGVGRYSLEYVQLRPATGQIAATDGRQLLVESGFVFPGDNELLIPASGLFDAAELNTGEPIEVGLVNNYLVFRCGRWRIWLAVREGRFPKFDDLLPSPTGEEATRLSIGSEDRDFLLLALDNLPGQELDGAPITLAIGPDEVSVLAKGAQDPQPTELVLKHSQATGPVRRVNTNRRFLARALRLGLREWILDHDEGRIWSADARRQYIWQSLARDQAIVAATPGIRINSGENGQPATSDSTPVETAPSNTVSVPTSVPKTRRKRKPRLAVETAPSEAATSLPETPLESPPEQPVEIPSVAIPSSNGHATQEVLSAAASPIEQAIALRDSLRELTSQANTLVAALRRQQRHSRLVESTLKSIRELQNVA